MANLLAQAHVLNPETISWSWKLSYKCASCRSVNLMVNEKRKDSWLHKWINAEIPTVEIELSRSQDPTSIYYGNWSKNCSSSPISCTETAPWSLVRMASNALPVGRMVRHFFILIICHYISIFLDARLDTKLIQKHHKWICETVKKRLPLLRNSVGGGVVGATPLLCLSSF